MNRKIPALYWLARPERREFLTQVEQDGTRLFPFFSTEGYALDYQEAHGLSGWTVWGNDTEDYVLRVLDTVAEGYDIYVIDPPTERGATVPYYTLNDMKAYVRRKADEGAAW